MQFASRSTFPTWALAAALLAPLVFTHAVPAEPAPAPDDDVALVASALSWSSALRTRTVLPGRAVDLPLAWTRTRPEFARFNWIPTMGTPGMPFSGLLEGATVPAPQIPGTYSLAVEWPGGNRLFEDFTLIVKVPFDRKENGRIGSYRIGTFPTEGERREDRYAAPDGFIEVTRANQHTRLSDHFTLREFLTKDQTDVWPKYVVLDTRLLDKLELVMTELGSMGVPAERMIVMSGFRTPQYNRQGLSAGRASLSRHQFGDAADVWVDNDGDWYIDDLDGDGRRDLDDARVMIRAIERVEARHPELIGGTGLYRDNGVHGPFVHIDVRGHSARW